MYGYIYKTTNLLNGKIYIGQHKSNKFDIAYFGSGKHILSSIKKHGIKNFKCELIEWCDTRSSANSKERYWIKYYNATNKNIGYNITEGGDGWSGVTHSQASKDKISKSKIGKRPNRDYTKISNSTKNKISNTLKIYYKTHKNPRYGVHLSDETKEKLRQANLGKTYSQEIKDKHRHQAWNKGVPMTEKAKQHLKEINMGRVVKRRTVGQFDLQDNLIATFISCTDAERHTGFKRPQITKCCLNYCKSAYGYKWKYLE